MGFISQVRSALGRPTFLISSLEPTAGNHYDSLLAWVPQVKSEDTPQW